MLLIFTTLFEKKMQSDNIALKNCRIMFLNVLIFISVLLTGELRKSLAQHALPMYKITVYLEITIIIYYFCKFKNHIALCNH